MTAFDLDRITEQTIDRLIQRAPSAEEREWVDSLRQLAVSEWDDASEIEARRLYWERQLELDKRWATPTREMFTDPDWQRLMDQYEIATAEG